MQYAENMSILSINPARLVLVSSCDVERHWESSIPSVNVSAPILFLLASCQQLPCGPLLSPLSLDSPFQITSLSQVFLLTMLVTQTHTSPRTHYHHLHTADMTFDLRDVLERSRGEGLSRVRRPAEACRAGRLWVMRETRGIVAHLELEWPARLSLVTKCKSQLGGYNLHSGRKSRHGRVSNTLALLSPNLSPPSLPPSKLLRPLNCSVSLSHW